MVSEQAILDTARGGRLSAIRRLQQLLATPLSVVAKRRPGRSLIAGGIALALFIDITASIIIDHQHSLSLIHI